MDLCSSDGGEVRVLKSVFLHAEGPPPATVPAALLSRRAADPVPGAAVG